ncbi:maleylpyruvate isomerase N-terminal domain-containing protein [Streptomyces sp. NPDC020802]|uniref:maleylpyruvate isomerase N-terminal domain-containing protein n=1 Tax=Streptomyces sp. NPDC020802 TaxID=3365094 RepID=UPI0037ACDB28
MVKLVPSRTVDSDIPAASTALPAGPAGPAGPSVRSTRAAASWPTASSSSSTPMYADDDQRANEIEANARRPADELGAALLAADGRLCEALTTLPDECWSVTVRTARGRAVSASEVPWMRVREVWVHTFDLNAGTGFDDVPRVAVKAEESR